MHLGGPAVFCCCCCCSETICVKKVTWLNHIRDWLSISSCEKTTNQQKHRVYDIYIYTYTSWAGILIISCPSKTTTLRLFSFKCAAFLGCFWACKVTKPLHGLNLPSYHSYHFPPSFPVHKRFDESFQQIPKSTYVICLTPMNFMHFFNKLNFHQRISAEAQFGSSISEAEAKASDGLIKTGEGHGKVREAALEFGGLKTPTIVPKFKKTRGFCHFKVDVTMIQQRTNKSSAKTRSLNDLWIVICSEALIVYIFFLTIYVSSTLVISL